MEDEQQETFLGVSHSVVWRLAIHFYKHRLYGKIGEILPECLMTDVSAYDELSTLLDLMLNQWEEVETPKTPQLLAKKSRFYSLLKGWSKRTSVADQQQALSKLRNHQPRVTALGVALWAGEQTLQYPKHTPWNTPRKLELIITTLLSNDHLDFVDQVSVVLDLYTLHPNEYLVEYIVGGLPSWAFTNPQTRSKVVDFYVQAFSLATVKNSDVVGDALENTKPKDFKQIANEVQKRCAPDVQKILKFYTLRDLLNDGENTWKNQKQLLTELGETIVMDNDNFSYAAENGFLKNPTLMVQWLEYAAEHWSAPSFKRLTSWCVEALCGTLNSKTDSTAVWASIAALPGTSELFAKSLARFILESPLMTVTDMRTASQHLNSVIGNPTVAPVAKNLVLKQIDVSQFFASCERSADELASDEHFVDKKLTQRMTSTGATSLVKKLQLLHPSFSDTLRVLMYTVGGEKPDNVAAVAKCGKKQHSMDSDFSRPWSRWEALSQKSVLNKVVKNSGVDTPSKAKRKM